MRPPRRPFSVALAAKPDLSRFGRRSGFPARPGFTLIEIMVAISIIIVLTALGLVAFRKVSDSSYKQQTQLLMKELLGLEGEYFAATGQRVNHYSRSGAAYADTQTPYDWTANKNYDHHDDGTAHMVVPNASYTVDPDAADKGSIEAFVWATWQVPACQKMYTRLLSDKSCRDGDTSLTIPRWTDHVVLDATNHQDPDLNDPSDPGNPKGFYEIVDPWGTRLRYYLKNTKGPPNQAPDYDAHYSSTNILGPDGQPVYSKVPFFVSAGPDGRFGWDDPDPNNSSNQNMSPVTNVKSDAKVYFTYTAQEQAKYAADNIYSFNLE